MGVYALSVHIRVWWILSRLHFPVFLAGLTSLPMFACIVYSPLLIVVLHFSHVFVHSYLLSLSSYKSGCVARFFAPVVSLVPSLASRRSFRRSRQVASSFLSTFVCCVRVGRVRRSYTDGQTCCFRTNFDTLTTLLCAIGSEHSDSK